MAVVKKILLWLLTLAVAAGSVSVTAVMLAGVVLSSGNPESAVGTKAVDVAVMDRYDMYITNQKSHALEGVLAIDKVYWLSDADQIAPEPDQSKFGTTDDPSTLGWFLEDAQKILDGQTTLFSTDIEIGPKTEVMYYLDDSIMVITWKQVLGGVMYTISEVKIAHPTQFRRFLAGGTYGSPIQLTTSEMATSVNAVVASSGDFYAFRRMGVIVYDGTVQRVDTEKVDTCYINEDGDLLFFYRGELPDMESAQAFVDENNIRFSVAFGPVLVDNGEPTQIGVYSLGEIHQNYARAALCQRDDLHYLLITANAQWPALATHNIYQLQEQILAMDCKMAYTLDGGQTAAIVMNDQLINNVVFGEQRNVSDIIYFATAVPETDGSGK